ncbi:hypothetical protein GW915_06055 [bacterium]|nr:hypothetical protein [bacterium]
MATVAVDLDGTIFNYTETGEPILIAGAREVMKDLFEQGHEVVIYTCRMTEASGESGKKMVADLIKRMLGQYDIPYTYIYKGDKFVADVYIDDRAVGFEGDWKDAGEQVSLMLDPKTNSH